MAKFKTIIAPISLVIEKGGAPVEPGTPVRLPEADADSIIERFGAVEHVEEKPKRIVKAAKGEGGDGEGDGDGGDKDA